MLQLEVFAVSIVYWASILGIGMWLYRRLSSLKQKLANLEEAEER